MDVPDAIASLMGLISFVNDDDKISNEQLELLIDEKFKAIASPIIGNRMVLDDSNAVEVIKAVCEYVLKALSEKE